MCSGMFLLRIEIKEEQDGRTSGIQRLDLILSSCIYIHLSIMILFFNSDSLGQDFNSRLILIAQSIPN